MKVKSESEVSQSCPTLLQPHGLQPPRLLCPWDFPGKSTGAGYHRLLREDRDCTFFPVSLVYNNSIILAGKADQFWQPWWERWILHLPRLGAGGPSLEGMLNGYTWVRQEALGSHTPVTTRQAGLGALPLSFWKPQGSCCLKYGLWLFRNTVFLPRHGVAKRPAVKCRWGRVRGPGSQAAWLFQAGRVLVRAEAELLHHVLLDFSSSGLSLLRAGDQNCYSNPVMGMPSL